MPGDKETSSPDDMPAEKACLWGLGCYVEIGGPTICPMQSPYGATVQDAGDALRWSDSNCPVRGIP